MGTVAFWDLNGLIRTWTFYKRHTQSSKTTQLHDLSCNCQLSPAGEEN